MDWLDILLVSLFIFVVWLMFVGIYFLYIYSQVPPKHREKYPFFSKCWIKKLFLVGLNGAIKPSVVIFTFLVNISLCLWIASGIWWSVIPASIAAQWSYRIMAGVFGICFLVRFILLWGNLPKFK